MKRLTDGRSPRWAFLDVFRVPQYDGDGDYLWRLRVVQTPWFALYLHRFDGPDPRETLHDHPWNFWSIVLRGGYIERRLDPVTMVVNETHLIRRFNRVHAGDAHAIMRLLRSPTWTLMLVGRRRRTWGYLEPEDVGWRWTEFDLHPHNDEFAAALARRFESKNA